MKLFTPGPVEVPKEVLEAASRKTIHHRDEEFHRLFESVTTRFAKLADLDGYVALLPGSGTTAVDAAIWSTLCRGEKVLALVRGEFGERVVETLVRRGAEVTVLRVELGKHEPLEKVVELLDAKSFSAVVIVHTETSAGTTYPRLRELARVCRSRGVKLIVDAVSSFAGEEFSMRWGVSVIATTTQKAIASIPGVAIVGVSEGVVEDVEKCSKTAPLCLDLRRYIEYGSRRETPFTPAINALYALDRALERIEKVGIERYVAMHRERASLLYRELPSMGFEPLPKSVEARSSTVVAMKSPAPAPWLKSELRKRGFLVALGMKNMRGTVIRIGTMGAITMEDVKNLIDTIREIVASSTS